MYLNSSFERMLNFCSSRSQILHGEKGLDLIPGFAFDLGNPCGLYKHSSVVSTSLITLLLLPLRTGQIFNIRVRCSLFVI